MRQNVALMYDERRTLFLRGQMVMLSSDVAKLYDIDPKVLVQAAKRNPERFPEDFMFFLTEEEQKSLKASQMMSRWGGARRGMPCAFTGEGIMMLSSVLRNSLAAEVNINLIRLLVEMHRLNEGNVRGNLPPQSIFEVFCQMKYSPKVIG